MNEPMTAEEAEEIRRDVEAQLKEDREEHERERMRGICAWPGVSPYVDRSDR